MMSSRLHPPEPTEPEPESEPELSCNIAMRGREGGTAAHCCPLTAKLKLDQKNTSKHFRSRAFFRQSSFRMDINIIIGDIIPPPPSSLYNPGSVLFI